MTKKIAICYYGLTRSTRFVYESHFLNLFDSLKDINIDYKIFIHTWKVESHMNRVWGDVIDMPPDYEEYKLLQPHYYKIDEQKLFTEQINFSDYFNRELYERYGGDTHYEWRPELIMNSLCSLESQKRVYEMVKESGEEFDFIMFVRPDVMFTNKFDATILNTDFDVIIPGYDHWEGYNALFAILQFNKSSPYAYRINEIIDFRKNHGRVVAEKYLKFIIDKYYSKLHFVNFQMKIIRPNGC